MLAFIVLLPFAGFLINGIWYLTAQVKGGKAISARNAGSLATGCIAGSFFLSLALFVKLIGLGEEERVLESVLFPWIQVGLLDISFALRMDALNVLFALVITGVGTLIHIFSIGYMGHDESPAKFFAYLNLFCSFMLVLVLGASLPVLFLGWEGVGLCSYLLISYWYTDPEKASAGKKAFVVNRVGDFGFLIGMFLLYTTFGTLDFAALKEAFATLPAAPGILTAIGLLLFVGCMGKSAQLPLFVWLPDAMAGPTPVSALIHAATMVTSGVYLLARMSFLYAATPDALSVIAGVGAATALFAATIALVQNDIKKVLAYSTVSQLGLMFLACGVGAYATGVFHVITHAFFKALLFLSAGSVIHGMHEEQDIQKMGGLRSSMPQTFFVFAAGWLAISGIPPFSGFFSKDEILWQAFSSAHGGPFLWAVASVTALLTAFYMSRLFILTFLGKARSKEASHAHESPWVMLLPLQVLAVLSIAGGFMGVPHASWLEHWLHPVLAHAPELRTGVHHETEWFLMGFSVVVAAAGIAGAFMLYRGQDAARKLTERFRVLHTVLFHKWYVDEFYDAVIVKPIAKFSGFLWKNFDVKGIDRVVLGFGTFAGQSGSIARTLQTGSTQLYTFLILVGFASIVGVTLYGIFR
jgi:NADH-quinone oxidoreductase subunit L